MPLIWLFLPAAFLITLSPGPDNMQVLARGMGQGRATGLVAAWGFASGTLIHTILAMVGVAALLKANPYALNIIRYLGVIYLLWLAWGALRSQSTFSETQVNHASLKRIFSQSILGCMLNPKVSIFFLMFFPQFVNPQGFATSYQLLLLGIVFMLQAGVVFSVIAWFSGAIRNWLLKGKTRTRYLDRAAGMVFVLVALKLALDIGG